jgi:hypothetical protein
MQGAYTLSMVSRYNSRCSPPVYGFSSPAAAAGGGGAGGGVLLSRLRGRETLRQVLDFWNIP